MKMLIFHRSATSIPMHSCIYDMLHKFIIKLYQELWKYWFEISLGEMCSVKCEGTLLNCLSAKRKNVGHLFVYRGGTEKNKVLLLVFTQRTAFCPQLSWQPVTRIMKAGVRKSRLESEGRPLHNSAAMLFPDTACTGETGCSTCVMCQQRCAILSEYWCRILEHNTIIF